jgi:deoxyribonuclease-4
MRLGAHMSVEGGKYMALERGKQLGCESIQLFIRNVRSWKSGTISQDEVDKFLETRKTANIWPLMSHDSYLINLASLDPEKLEKSYNALLDDLQKSNMLGIEYENIHPGVIPKRDRELITLEEALSQIADQLNKLMKATENFRIIILLETTAGQGEGLGSEFQHLKFIINKIHNKNRIGVCFDTAHSFAAGYDFRTKKKYNEMWDEFDDIIGFKYLHAFHLNDAVNDCGSRTDRHTHIGQGKIGKEAFGFLVNDERFVDLPGILETPKGKDMKEDIMNLNTLRSLIK